MANFENYKSNISIEGSYIDNYGTNVTIYGYNDTIYGNKIYSRRGNNVIIVAGAGSDSVTVAGGTKISINGGADYDYIINYEKSWNEETQSYETVAAEKVTIDGGDGNDSIINHSWNPTISGDEDDDIVLSFNDGNVYLYAPGDGNDSIYGFGNEDTLKISSTAYSTQINGEDFVIKVDEVSINPRLTAVLQGNSQA